MYLSLLCGQVQPSTDNQSAVIAVQCKDSEGWVLSWFLQAVAHIYWLFIGIMVQRTWVIRPVFRCRYSLQCHLLLLLMRLMPNMWQLKLLEYHHCQCDMVFVSSRSGSCWYSFANFDPFFAWSQQFTMAKFLPVKCLIIFLTMTSTCLNVCYLINTSSLNLSYREIYGIQMVVDNQSLIEPDPLSPS